MRTARRAGTLVPVSTQNIGGRFERVLRMGEGRRLKRLQDQAAYISTLEPEFEALSDEQLAGKTVEFKQRFANGESLEDLIFEAYAAVREAFKRTLGVRLFDVQLMGGIALHEGDIAEMKTGEGKTFVAVQALYLNGLTGRGVHLVTTNDYLAKRDAEWTRPVYELLGSSVGSIENIMAFAERREAYANDVTYGTNSEFGFDYLRDNMAVALAGTVQRSHAFAIVDEVDSILIDEARTPLIISGEPETAASTYHQFAKVVKVLEGQPATRKSAKGEDETELSGADYLYDEKFKTVSPAQSAIAEVERALGIDNLYDPRHVLLVNHLIQALKAQSLYKRDVDYVVQEGEVKIVDEFTGRIMEGRRWSEGSAPGGRGQGGHADPRGERHPRDDHAPELLPSVREARRDDRVRRRPRRRSSSRSTTCTSSRSPRTSGSLGSTRTTSSSRHPRPSSQRCSRILSSATRTGSRSLSARSRSRPPSTCRSC